MTATSRSTPRAALAALALLITLTLGGCAAKRVVQVYGYPDADVFVENPPGSGSFTFVGRTKQRSGERTAFYRLDYALPGPLWNQVVKVRIRGGDGQHDYRVYTDRDVEVAYPPQSTDAAADGVEAMGAHAPHPTRPSRAPAPTEKATRTRSPSTPPSDAIQSGEAEATITEE